MDSIVDVNKLAHVRDLVLHSEEHFNYFFLATYQRALYFSWIKDPSNKELNHEFDKRREAFNEQLTQFYPSNTNDGPCLVLRQIANVCASLVARTLKVIIVSTEKTSPGAEAGEVFISHIRVAIDSIRADIKLHSPNTVGEVKFRAVPKQNSPEQFLLTLWLFDAAGNQVGNGPHICVKETQISGVNGFTMAIPEPKESKWRNKLSMQIFWEIAPVQEHFPLCAFYWLQKIPLIMAHIGGQVDEANGRSASYWRAFEPLYRACVGTWRQWAQSPGLGREALSSLSKLYFLLPERVQRELAIQVLVRFCEETVQPSSSEDKVFVREIASETAFVHLVAENLTLYHNQLSVHGRVKVLKWLATNVTGCDIRTLFGLLKYGEQIVCKSTHGRHNHDRNQVEAISQLNWAIMKQVRQLNTDEAIESIIQAYSDNKGRVRDDQGELRKMRSTRRPNGAKLARGTFCMQPGCSPNGIVRRISQYLLGLCAGLKIVCDKRLAEIDSN